MAVLKRNYETRVKPKLGLIEGWFRHGLSVEQVCDNLGVSVSAFNRWANREIELRDAIEKGREPADIHVENAMFKRAVGYNVWEVVKERRPMEVVDANTGEVKQIFALVTTKKTLKQIVPDVQAQQYWLEHRASKRWQKQPKVILDDTMINNNLLSIVELINNPMPERQIGDEERDEVEFT